MPISVHAKPGESVDQVIKKFKKKVLTEDLLTTIREKEFYKKPSLVRKEKKAELRRRKKHFYV